MTRGFDAITSTVTIFRENELIRRGGKLALVFGLAVGLLVLAASKQARATIEPVNGGKTIVSAPNLAAFSQTQRPAFQIQTAGLVTETSQETNFNSFTADTGTIKVETLTADGEPADLGFQITSQDNQPDLFSVKLTDSSTVKPGRYRLKATLAGQGKEQVLEQDFLWGVLALNLNQSSYSVGERAIIGLAVLDDTGFTLCDAKLLLKVNSPNGEVAKLSTDEGSITVSDTCEDKLVTNKPDYLAEFEIKVKGVHRLALTAETVNGIRELEQSFEVTDEAKFVVSRPDTATRIYPLSPYTVSLKIQAKQDLDGQIMEKVPASFALSNVSNGGTSRTEGDRQTLTWPVKLRSGQTAEYFYTYDPPDESPQFYLLGPLDIAESVLNQDGGLLQQKTIWSEPRPWQIASDTSGAQTGVRLYTTGFELNTTTADAEYTANVNSPSISSTTYRSGAYALRANPSASTAGISYNFKTADTQDDFYLRAYVYVATAPNTLTSIMTFRDNAATTQGSIRMNADRTLELWNDEDSVQIGSDSSAVAASTWTRIEFRFDPGTLTAVTEDVRVDGIRFASDTAQNMANGVRTIQLGVLDTNATADIFFDDVALNDDNGGTSTNWPSEGKIVYARPNGNGTNTAWTGDNTAVDESPENDGTDYVACTTNNQIEDFTLTDTGTLGIGAYDNIRLAAAYTRVRLEGSANLGYTLALLDASANADTSAGIQLITGTQTWYTNDDTYPHTALVSSYNMTGTGNNSVDPITPSDFDGFQVRLTGSDCSPQVWISTVWVMVEYQATEGGRIWSSGFELQSVTAGVEWSGSDGTTAIDTSVKRGGAASLKAASLASATREALNHQYATANGDGPYFIRVYLNITTPPSAENRIIDLKDSGGTARAYLTLSSTGTLALYDEDGQVGSASAALTTTFWYRVELKFDSSGAGATDTIEARINGTNFATSSTRNLTNGVYQLGLGGNLNSEVQTTGSWNFDDVAINANAGSTQNSYPGNGTLTHIRPNSDSTTAAWTVQGCTDGTDYQCVDEVTPDSGTTYIESTTGYQVSLFNLDSASTAGISSNDTVTLAAVGIQFRNDAATLSGVKISVEDASSTARTESDQIGTLDTNWKSFRDDAPFNPNFVLYTRPNRTDVLRPDVVDGLIIGLRLITDGGTNNLEVSALWMLVEYIPYITVAGTVYSDEGSTAIGNPPCDGSTSAVRVRVNGADSNTATSCAIANSTYTTSAIAQPNDGDTLTVYLDGVTANGTYAKIYSGSGNVTGANIYQDRVWVVGTNMTNTNLDEWDSGDEGDGVDGDLGFTVTSGALTVSNTRRLLMTSTFVPGGSITTNAGAVQSAVGGDFDIGVGSTVTMSTNALSIGGDYADCATVSATQTTTLTATATGFSLPDCDYQNVTFNGSGGGWSFSAATETIAGNLTMTAGTLSGTGNINVDGGAASGDGTITLTGGTFRLDGTGSFGGANAWTFATLTFGDGSGSTTSTASGTGGVTVSNVLTIAASQTLDAGSKTWTLSGTTGTPFVSSGTFTASTSTVSYTGNYASGNTNITNVTYKNLTLNNASETWVLAGATTTVGGDLTVTAGTLADTDSINVNGGDLTGDGTVTMTGGTVTLSGTGNFGGATAWTFYDLTFGGDLSPVSTTATGAGGITVSNVLTLGLDRTLNAGSKTWTLSGTTGTPLTGAGTFTADTSTVSYTGNYASGNTTVATVTYYKLTLNNVSETYVLAAATDVNNDLTITAGILDTVLGQNYGLTVGGSWSNTGTFTARSGTVTFDAGATGKTVTAGGSSFYIIDFNGSGGGWTLQDALTATNVTVTAGTLTDNAQTVTANGSISIANAAGVLVSTGTWVQGANGNISNPNGASSFANKFSTLQINSGVTSTRTGAIQVNKLVMQASSTLTADTSARYLYLGYPTVNDFLDLASGADITTAMVFYYGSNSTTRTQKAFTITVDFETRYCNTCTIQLTGSMSVGNLYVVGATSSDTEAEAAVLDTSTYNLTVNGFLRIGATNASYPNGYQGKVKFSSGTHTVTGNVSVVQTSPYTYGYFDLGSSNTTIGGSVDFRYATVTPGTSTVILNAGATGKTINNNSQSFYDLTFNNASGGWTFQDAADIDRDFTITAGAVTAPASTTLTIARHFANSGTFTHNSGTVVLDTTTTATVSGATTFNSFTSTTANKTIQFQTSGAPVFTFAGTFTITGTSGNNILVYSDLAATKWKAHFNSSQSTVTYATIRDGGCDTGTSQVASSSTNTNSGNNEWCWFRDITFNLDASSKNFGTVTPGASASDQTSTVTVSSNAASGYQVTLWATQLLTNEKSATLANWTGTNATPTTLSGAGTSAFGYNTNDSDLGGGTANRFTSAANLYAGFASSGAGDIVADNTGTASSEAWTITYRLRTASDQESGLYTTTLVYIMTPTY